MLFGYFDYYWNVGGFTIVWAYLGLLGLLGFLGFYWW